MMHCTNTLKPTGDTQMTNTMNDVTKTFETAMKPVTEFNNFFMKTSESTFAK